MTYHYNIDCSHQNLKWLALRWKEESRTRAGKDMKGKSIPMTYDERLFQKWLCLHRNRAGFNVLKSPEDNLLRDKTRYLVNNKFCECHLKTVLSAQPLTCVVTGKLLHKLTLLLTKTPLSKTQPALTHSQFLSKLVLTLLLRLNNHSLPPWLFFDVTEAFQGGLVSAGKQFMHL